jgi:RHS repeat-associated protein
VGKSQYQTDTDSGLMLLGHRYYDASVGRFLSSDPAQAGNNWYKYCENNPLKEIDPLGLWSLYRWLYTGDGNASDEVYNAALDAGADALNRWWGHFKDRNRKEWPSVVVKRRKELSQNAP